MSKSSSFFDWENQFKSTHKSKLLNLSHKDSGHHSNKKVKVDLDPINSIGIPLSKYKNFLKEWKEKNLP